MAQEYARIILDFLECDRVAEKRHLMAAGVVVKPEMIETVTRCLSLIRRVTDVEHDGRLLIEELFEDYCYNIEYLGIIGAMFVLTVVDKEMVCTIIHKECIFIEADDIVYLLVSYKAESEVVNLRQMVRRTHVKIVGR